MKNILAILLLFQTLYCVTRAQKLHTCFLTPNITKYNSQYGYFVCVLSNNRKLCDTGFFCEDRPMLSDQMLPIYEKCGMHSFRDYIGDHIYSVNLTNFPHQVSSLIYFQGSFSFEVADCVETLGALYCMPEIDRDAVQCVQNSTQIHLKSRVCAPWWSLVVTIGIICIVVTLVTIFSREKCREKFKFLTFRDIEDLDTDVVALLSQDSSSDDSDNQL